MSELITGVIYSAKIINPKQITTEVVNPFEIYAV